MMSEIDWEKRGRAAEAVLVKYYNLLKDCPEFIEWEKSLGEEKHWINKKGKIEPVIPESMRKWMEVKEDNEK